MNLGGIYSGKTGLYYYGIVIAYQLHPKETLKVYGYKLVLISHKLHLKLNLQFYELSKTNKQNRIYL